jgi:heme O synthase-like polyprenyltransferase
MLKRSQRIGIAAGSLALSLPAFIGVFAATFFVYAIAVFGG